MLSEQTFMIANGCNLSCTYCWYETGSASYVTESLSPGVYDRWLGRCVDRGVDLRQINITGGEPLLRADFCDLLAVASRRARNVSVFTNGLLLGGEILAALRAARCEVHVSIDHVSPGLGDRVRGGTAATLRGIEALATSGVEHAQLCMVVTSRNHREVTPVRELADRHRYALELIPVALPAHHPLSLMSLPEQDRGELAAELAGAGARERPGYYARFRRYLQTGTVDASARCRAAERGVFIDADGRIALCTQRTAVALGDVASSDPDDVLAAKERAAADRRPGSCVSLDCLVLV
ncbi:radical SAM protein [Cellulomonas wangsupingiae]|uniref:radical SAM protein n=1 Tax=Cellulomonas wangsupingiae TaxID=2968085 RepID=UPI001D0F2ABE|nr:radical SAM protein [Cellulomonas wangsupingiae]MCM0638963.1 radical SAM protein [Cellulomonas wangsupingiae]